MLIERGDGRRDGAGGAEATITPLGIGGFCGDEGALRAERRPRRRRAGRSTRTATASWPARARASSSRGARAREEARRPHLLRAGRLRRQRRRLPHHLAGAGGRGRGSAPCAGAAGRRARPGARSGYMNAHGTSTPQGDIAETKAIKRVFGDCAKKASWSRSTKSMTGHLLGAAGGVEAVFSVLALHAGVLPPTINLEDAGPGVRPGRRPEHRRARGASTRCMSNSFGFGGTNAVLCFKRFNRSTPTSEERIAERIIAFRPRRASSCEPSWCGCAKEHGFEVEDLGPFSARERGLPRLRAAGGRGGGGRAGALRRAGLRHRHRHEHRRQQGDRACAPRSAPRARGAHGARAQRRERALPGRAGHRRRAGRRHRGGLPRPRRSRAGGTSGASRRSARWRSNAGGGIQSLPLPRSPP